MITKKRLKELRELAEKATPGKYNIERRDGECGQIDYVVYSNYGKDIASCDEIANPLNRDNANYIAALDPKVVVELLDAIEVLTEALSRVSDCTAHSYYACHYADVAKEALGIKEKE